MKNESKSDEIKRAIENALGLSGKGGSGDAVERVLEVLEQKKVFRYQKDETVGLISSAGRILTVLIDDPTMTQRAIAVYLDMSETMVDRTIKSLIAAGLLTKTKVNRQNIYNVSFENVLKHIDIRSIYAAIQKAKGEEPPQKSEEEPF
jgi:predicted transcriptional regulator